MPTIPISNPDEPTEEEKNQSSQALKDFESLTIKWKEDKVNYIANKVYFFFLVVQIFMIFYYFSNIRCLLFIQL